MSFPPDLTQTQLDRARFWSSHIFRTNNAIRSANATLATLGGKDDVTNKAFAERLDFKLYIDKLAGLAEFFQRQHPQNHSRVQIAYRFLLMVMHAPPPLPGGYNQPRRVDFAALHPAARPYLLGAYLNIHQADRLPEVDLTLSRPTEGRIVIVQHGGPVDVILWRSKLPDINAWLNAGDTSKTWAITGHTATSLTLTAQPKLPAAIPYARTMLKRDALYAGIDTTTRTPHHIPFAAMTSGTLVAGVAGSGKSNAIHILMRSLLANHGNFQHIYAIDGKDGVAFNRYRDLTPKLTVLWEEGDFWKLTPHLLDIMRTRNAQQRHAGRDNATDDYIAVIVDEMATYTAKPSLNAKSEANKAHAQFLDELIALVRRGRSTGFRFFFSVQEPNESQIPSALRANCQTVISFRLGLSQHATDMFGQLDSLPTDPRKLTRGQALIRDGQTGTLNHVQFPVIP
ncbi:MAG: FtsK/SpoIIIE domain-containing protein [Hyphomicrobiaceae bacterium]